MVSDEEYMREALAEAEMAFKQGEVPIGAILVRDGCIIGRGHNLRETTGDPTAHAEMVAIRSAVDAGQGWRLSGTTMYVTIEPCPMCAGALVQARVQRLVYGAPDIKAGAAGSVMNIVACEQFNHRLAMTSGVLEEACKALMQNFFRQLRERDARRRDG